MGIKVSVLAAGNEEVRLREDSSGGITGNNLILQECSPSKLKLNTTLLWVTPCNPVEVR
jgi:hypothetical protein